jgi:hypothetical protein
MPAPAPYYFLHIPKTAGTSVIAWLQQAGCFRMCPHQIWSLMIAADRETLKQYDLFVGHLYRSLPEYLALPLRPFTFVRHPIERAYSHYRHVLHDSNHYFHEEAAKGKTFKAFMENPKTQPLVRDFQVRALAAVFDTNELASRGVHDEGKLWLERLLETAPSGFSKEVELARAKQFLSQCICVGIAERMAESVTMLANALAIDQPGPALHLNSNARPEEAVSDEELLLAVELNGADRELYAFALNLFDRQNATPAEERLL